MNANNLIAQLPKLPAPSPSVVKLLALLSRPEADQEEIIQVVSQDGVLCAKLLGLCNAASYGLASPVGWIDQAVMYLGHSEIHRLVMAVGFGGALSPILEGYAIGAKELWRHSLLTAYVAVDTALRVPQQEIDPGIAYTAGLIHDIGKVVISHAINPAAQAKILELIETKHQALTEAERFVVGNDHAEVGAALLRQWQLPEILVEAVANHHQPVFQPQVQLSAVVHVADVIALQAGYSPGLGSYAMRADEGAIAALGLNGEDMEHLVIMAFDALAKVEERQAVA